MSRLIMSREVPLYITAKSFQFVDKNYNIIIIIKLGKNDNKRSTRVGEEPFSQHSSFLLADFRGKNLVAIGFHQRAEPVSFNSHHQPIITLNVITNDNTADVTLESISDIANSRRV